MFHQSINSVGSHYDGTVYRKASWDYHFHDSFELIYILNGNVNISLHTGMESLSEGEFFLISPAVVHSIDSSDDSLFFIAIFTQDFVSEFPANSLKMNYFRFIADNTIFTLFEKYMLHSQSYNRYMIKSCLYALCDSANNSATDMQNINSNSEFIFKINKYISENFNLDITRKNLASALNYEEHYFSSLFSKNTNMNLKTYINIYRFAFAQKLLVSTDMPITQIAFECGFKSIRSFNKIFRDLSGTTPGSYRKKHTSPWFHIPWTLLFIHIARNFFENNEIFS